MTWLNASLPLAGAKRLSEKPALDFSLCCLVCKKPVALLCLGPVHAFYEKPMLVEEGWATPRPLSELLYLNRWGSSGE